MITSRRGIYLTLLLGFWWSRYVCGLVSDGDILLRFKASIEDKQKTLDSWGRQGEDPCRSEESSLSTWTGVTCENRAGSGPVVTELHLSSFSLEGSRMSALAGLNLTYLDLSDNAFSGVLDERLLDGLPLQYLNLSNNRFSGRLPYFPSSLIEVDLGNNLFIGELSGTDRDDGTNVFNLQLQTLHLQGNNFTGVLPPLSQLRLGHLTNFDVSDNHLEGPIPMELMNLQSMSYCNMSGNKFTGFASGVYRSSRKLLDPMKTVVMDLSRNRLIGIFPSAFFPFGNMEVYLNDNYLVSLGTNFPENVTVEFQKMYLQNNRFSTRDINNILRSNFPTLEELLLDGNNRSHSVHVGPQEVFSGANHTFPKLRVLSLRGCGLGGTIPAELFNNATLPSLEVLDLSQNEIVGSIPISVTQMPRLRELRLQQNFLVGTLPALSNMTSLEVLNLAENALLIRSSELQDLLTSSHLKELRLSRNAISLRRLPKLLRRNSSLEVLDLSFLQLEGTIPSEYGSSIFFPRLSFLSLSSNYLLGSVPDGFGIFPSLKYLDLSFNRLSGRLPSLPDVLLNSTFFTANDGLCGPPLESCQALRNKGPATWIIVLLVTVCVAVSGCSCLCVGWIWRRNIDAKRHEQDAELIATLLDRDYATSLMPLRELRKATNDFSEENQIGQGGFGSVYKGTLADGTVVAIKKSNQDTSTQENKCQFLNEVKILSQIHQSNLVRLLGCCLAHKNALLVFEFVPNGTLQQHLHQEHSRTPLSWNRRLTIAIQTATALDYLHSSINPPIYHLDVKSTNILLDDNLNAKVADFGIAKLAAAPDATHITVLHGFHGTIGYIDPEAVVRSKLTDKSDVYSFGAVLLELLTAKDVVDRSRGENVSLVKWAGALIQAGKLAEVIDPVIFVTFQTPEWNGSINAVARLAVQCLSLKSEDRPSMKLVAADLLKLQENNRPSTSENLRVITYKNKEMLEMSTSVKLVTI